MLANANLAAPATRLRKRLYKDRVECPVGLERGDKLGEVDAPIPVRVERCKQLIPGRSWTWWTGKREVGGANNSGMGAEAACVGQSVIAGAGEQVSK